MIYKIELTTFSVACVKFFCGIVQLKLKLRVVYNFIKYYHWSLKGNLLYHIYLFLSHDHFFLFPLFHLFFFNLHFILLLSSSFFVPPLIFTFLCNQPLLPFVSSWDISLIVLLVFFLFLSFFLQSCQPIMIAVFLYSNSVQNTTVKPIAITSKNPPFFPLFKSFNLFLQ